MSDSTNRAEYIVKNHEDYHAKYDAINAEMDRAAITALQSDEAYKDPRDSRRIIRTLAALEQYFHDHPDVETAD